MYLMYLTPSVPYTVFFMLSFNKQMLTYHQLFFGFFCTSVSLAFCFLSLYFPGVCISV